MCIRTTSDLDLGGLTHTADYAGFDPLDFEGTLEPLYRSKPPLNLIA